MNEQLPINRVEMELSQWRSREERFSKLFSFSLSNNKSLLKEKLHHYERISTKYKGSPNMDERFALRMLKQEKKNPKTTLPQLVSTSYSENIHCTINRANSGQTGSKGNRAE